MADINKLSPLILKWEGGYVNNPHDLGGATNKGVTLATWRILGHDNNGDGVINENDVKLISVEDFTHVLKVGYWDNWKADSIKSQSLANILVDWVWGSGVWGIKIPQQLLGVVVDGQVGLKTINALNATDPKTFFKKVWEARLQFLKNIVKNNPSQNIFLKGWVNRLNDYKFES